MKQNKMQNKIQHKMFIIGILFINFIISSCDFFTKENTLIINDIVTIYDYQIGVSNLDKKELRDSTVTYIDTLNLYNRKNWIYALNDSISIYTPYAIEKDSFFLDNVYCPNLDTIHLKYKNEIIELIKSDYNVENSVDEEMYIYWNHDYGLVALYNYPWGALILFDKETMKGFAKEVFYNYIVNLEKENYPCK